MADNETRIKITAVDEATAKLLAIKGAASELTGSFTRLQGALGAIGVTAALGGLAATVNAAIKTAASLEELSQKTGIATKELSALDYAMRREGVSTEAFGKAVKELSKNMIEAGDASSKAGKLFAELGVNAQGGTREALLKIADTFQALPDGATKAALAVQLFGKAGMDMIPALNNGAEGIRQIEEEARKLGLTFSSDAGKQAKQFSDQMFALTESGKALGYALAETALPALVEITKSMVIAAQEGGKLKAVLVGLREAFSEFIIGDATKNRIEALKKQIQDLEELDKEGPGLLERITGLDQSENIKAKIRAVKAELAGLQAFAGAKPSSAPAGPKSDSDEVKALKARIDRILSGLSEKKPEIDSFGKELEALQLKIEATAAGFSQDFPKALATLNAALATGRISLAAHTDLMGKLIAQQPAFKAALETEAKAFERRTQLFREAQQAEVDAINARDSVLDRLKDGNDLLKDEIDLVGKTTLERELYLLKLEEERDLKSALTDEDEDYIRALYKEKAALLELRSTRAEAFESRKRDWESLGQNISGGLTNIFADALDGNLRRWSDWTKRLGDIFKRSVVDFAGNALNQLFKNLANGLASGNFSNLFSGVNLFGITAAGGGLLGGFGAQALGAGQRGVQAGSIFGTLFGGLPGAILGKLIDPDGPAQRSATFGPTAGSTNPTPFGFTSAFGQFSISDTRWFSDKDMGEILKNFFKGLASADNTIAGYLTPEERQRVIASLGIPRNYGFGTEGTDFSATLGEITLDRIKLVFEAIDPALTKLLDGFTGTNDELIQFATGILSVRSALKDTPIKGLTLESLEALKIGNETIVETFNRISGEWSQFQELFTTDGEKLSIAQKQIAQGFADLGIAIPKSSEEFKKLVEGLDLSTESGRTLFAALIKLAPGFAAVQSAAAGLLASFDQIVGASRPGYTKGVLEADRDTALGQFIARNPWAQGFSREYVLGQLRNITREDFQNYSLEDQTIINKILGITNELDGLGSAADTAAGALGGIGQGVSSAINSMRDVKMSIWDFLRGLLTDSEFSPLDPSQQLDTLKTRFTTAIAQAESGNIGAAQGIPDLIEQILRLGRTNFASGAGYTDLFNWVTGLAGDFVQPGGGMELQRLAYEEQRRQTNIMADVRALLISIRDGGTADGSLVASTVKNAALATERK